MCLVTPGLCRRAAVSGSACLVARSRFGFRGLDTHFCAGALRARPPPQGHPSGLAALGLAWSGSGVSLAPARSRSPVGRCLVAECPTAVAVATLWDCRPRSSREWMAVVFPLPLVLACSIPVSLRGVAVLLGAECVASAAEPLGPGRPRACVLLLRVAAVLRVLVGWVCWVGGRGGGLGGCNKLAAMSVGTSGLGSSVWGVL